jgi:hypothetical protein
MKCYGHRCAGSYWSYDDVVMPYTLQVLDMSVNGSHEWRSIASMSTRRSSVGVGVLAGLIYAVGG